MKKNYFLLVMMFLSLTSYSQRVILVNGGQYGNQSENANVIVYDVQTKTHLVIDTIHTQSVQDVLIEGDYVYVAAQDSIVRYQVLTNGSGSRVSAEAFPGVSTKTFAISGNDLLVGNWYAQSSDNLYIYDKFNLNVLDTISDVSKGAISIVTHQGFAYISQNSQTTSYTDTLGYIIKLDVANRTIVDTITVNGYTEDIGQLHIDPITNTMWSINSGSNTISTINLITLAATNTLINADLKVGNLSQMHVLNDTLFAKMNNGIGSIHLGLLDTINTNIIDTVVTAFTYDASQAKFYVTQTDFFSYASGKVYDRSGNKLDTFVVGYSPEVIRMQYDPPVGIAEFNNNSQSTFQLFPNPASQTVNVKGDNASFNQLRIFDLAGKLVFQETIRQEEVILNVSELPRGIYVVQLSNQVEQLNKKLILK